MAVGNGKLTFTISSTAYGIAVPLGSSFSVNGGGGKLPDWFSGKRKDDRELGLRNTKRVADLANRIIESVIKKAEKIIRFFPLYTQN